MPEVLLSPVKWHLGLYRVLERCLLMCGGAAVNPQVPAGHRHEKQTVPMVTSVEDETKTTD